MDNLAHELQPCEHLEGYWIQFRRSFRCYACGYQFQVKDLKHNPKRVVELWIGDGGTNT